MIIMTIEIINELTMINNNFVKLFPFYKILFLGICRIVLLYDTKS